jgi:hypothetical protein
VPRSLDAFAFIGRQLYPLTPFDPNRIHAE